MRYACGVIPTLFAGMTEGCGNRCLTHSERRIAVGIIVRGIMAEVEGAIGNP